MRKLVLTLLGSPHATWDDGAPLAFPTQRAFGLLAYLACCGESGASRTTLADLLWPGRDEETARTGLRRLLYELRQALGEEADLILQSDRERLGLRRDRLDCDVDRLRRAVASRSLCDAKQGLAKQAGTFLAGLNTGSSPYEDWAAAERQRILDLALEGLRTGSEEKLNNGAFEEALEAAATLSALDPANEAGCQYQMRALSGLGRRGEALKRFEAFKRHLAEDFEILPSEKTTQLVEHIRLGAGQLPEMPLSRPDMPSIAVLPFRNMTGAANYDYLVDSLSESITTELSRDRSLFVIASDSAEVYRERPIGAREIADELGIRYLVEGNVQLDPQRIRVEAKLIDGVRNALVWSERFDRARSGLLDIQDEIVAQIVAILRGYKGVIQKSELKRSRGKADIDLTAYEHLMRGMALKERFLKDDMREARSHFERAIEIAPDMAMAHGWLAWTWFFEVYMGWLEDTALALGKTFEAARRAVDLDPDLDFAHWALGAAHLAAGENGKSLERFDRAMELNPNNSDAMANRAWPLMFLGRTDEAIDNIERAMRLNPYFPDWYLWGLGMTRFARGDYAAAAECLERLLQPNDQSLGFLVASHHRRGDAAAAARAAQALRSLAPDFTIASFLSGLSFDDSAVAEELASALEAEGFPG